MNDEQAITNYHFFFFCIHSFDILFLINYQIQFISAMWEITLIAYEIVINNERENE